MLFGVLTLFRRHLTNCRHRPKGRKHRSCQCPLWVEGTLRGEKVRRSLDMRSWEAGQDLLREWESRGPNTALISVEDAVSRFLEDVAARNLAEATVAKQKVLLSRLTAFAEDVGGKYISQLAGESTLPFNREEFEGSSRRSTSARRRTHSGTTTAPGCGRSFSSFATPAFASAMPSVCAATGSWTVS